MCFVGRCVWQFVEVRTLNSSACPFASTTHSRRFQEELLANVTKTSATIIAPTTNAVATAATTTTVNPAASTPCAVVDPCQVVFCPANTKCVPWEGGKAHCVPTKCLLAIDTGTGDRLLPRFAFDLKTKTCVQFEFKETGGNANRFTSQNQCESECAGWLGMACYHLLQHFL